MSVLYKALQKAEKEHAEREAPAAPFDAARLAGSGVIRSAGGRRNVWRIAGAVVVVIFAGAMGVAYYLTAGPAAPPPRSAMLAPPTHLPQPGTPAPGALPGAPQLPTVVAQAPTAAAMPPSPASPPSAAPESQAAPAASPAPAPAPAATVAMATPEPSPPVADEKETGAAGSSSPPVKPSGAATTPKAAALPTHSAGSHEPMPEIAADSPARMLDPPISIHRSAIDLEGVGSAVSVRTVSQSAQDIVATAYTALVRGDYETAIGLYDQVLKQEPHSMMALLGRGAAMQKLGKMDQAHAAYDAALKLDPENREALTNVIAMEAEREPGDALKRLADLERDHPGFSPVKAQIGLIYARMGNLEGALDYLQRALVITPGAPLYLYNMALVLDRLGRKQEAAQAYDRVLEAMSGGQSIPELSIGDIQRRADFLRTQ